VPFTKAVQSWKRPCRSLALAPVTLRFERRLPAPAGAGSSSGGRAGHRAGGDRRGLCLSDQVSAEKADLPTLPTPAVDHYWTVASVTTGRLPLVPVELIETLLDGAKGRLEGGKTVLFNRSGPPPRRGELLVDAAIRLVGDGVGHRRLECSPASSGCRPHGSVECCQLKRVEETGAST